MPKDKTGWNKRIDWLIPRSRTQKTVFESAGIVATTSQSGSQSTQSTSNTIAASAAAKLLNDVVSGIDLDENVSAHEGAVRDYIGKIEHYTNHRLPNGLAEFNLTPVQWERVAQAADCAKMVHAADQPVNCIISTLTSRDGGTRGFGLYEYKPNAGERTIVVAFRATRNIMDWMANSNVAAMTYEELGSGAVVHSGLGSIARKTQHLLSKELDKAMSNSSLKYNTLFTGHSGGGAIAQLLFAFMNSESSALSFLREDGRISSIHCITFGSPPISNPSISSPSQSEFWCFCNEGDPVPLLEPDYAGILLKAWAEPLPSDTENREWRTPTPIFLPSGSQVAIRSEIDDGPRGPARRTSSFLLDLEARSCVLFGNPLSHSMANSYIPRIRELQLRASENLNPFDDPPHETGPNA